MACELGNPVYRRGACCGGRRPMCCGWGISDKEIRLGMRRLGEGKQRTVECVPLPARLPVHTIAQVVGARVCDMWRRRALPCFVRGYS